MRKDSFADQKHLPHIGKIRGRYHCRIPLIRGSSGAYALGDLLRHARVGEGDSPEAAYKEWKDSNSAL